MPIDRELDLRQLQALVAVAEQRSFGRAAAKLGFTQSAVSQQIAALERTLGTVLFDRPKGPRPVTLTDAGELVLEHAVAMIERAQRLEDDLARLQTGDAGQLVVGTFESVSVRLLPEVLRRLRAERPGVTIKLFDTNEETELHEGLASGQLDVSFLLHPADNAAVASVLLFEDPYFAVVPSGAEVGPLAVTRLNEVQLVGERAGTACDRLMEERLSVHGVHPEYVFRSGDNSAVQAMVRAGMGYAVMPSLAVDESDPGVDVLPLDPPIAPRRVHVGWSAERVNLPVLERFVELAREVAATIGGSSRAVAVGARAR